MDYSLVVDVERWEINGILRIDKRSKDTYCVVHLKLGVDYSQVVEEEQWEMND